MIDTKLETAEDKYGFEVYDREGRLMTVVPEHRVAESAVLQNWLPHQARGIHPPRPTLLQEPVRARVNHGRWLADCPYCGSAQVTSPNDQRFFCVECANAGLGGWLRVEWPDDINAIESLLIVRPPLNQNWLPDETPEVLAEENKQMLRSAGTTPAEVDQMDMLAQMDAIAVRQAANAALHSTTLAAEVHDEALEGGEDPSVLSARGIIPTAPPEQS